MGMVLSSMSFGNPAAERSPIRRGLKYIGLAPFVVEFLRSRTIPDQEGTEISADRGVGERCVRAAERSPIRRGLK